MRIAALILGILGGLASGGLGSKWLKDANEAKELLAMAAKAGADMSEMDSLIMGAYLLMITAVVSIAGGVMAFKGKGKPAGIAMIVFALSPLLFKGAAVIFTSLTLIGGILALRSKPA